MSRARLRILVAKIGLDGHDRGARLVTRILQDAGHEVIYTGLRQTVPAVIAAARDEDVDVIGVSLLSGAHMEIVAELVEARQEHGLDDVGIVLGGIIPRSDVPALTALGVAAVLPPGATISDVTGAVESASRRSVADAEC